MQEIHRCRRYERPIQFLGQRLGACGMVDQAEYWQTQSFDVQIITNKSKKGVYKVTTTDTANGKQITREYTVTLKRNAEYAWIDYRFTNSGTRAWTYDENPGHIHDGAVMTSVRSVEKYDIDAYINGVGVIDLPSSRWWDSYTPDQSAPFVVLFQPSNGKALLSGSSQRSLLDPSGGLLLHRCKPGNYTEFGYYAKEFTLRPAGWLRGGSGCLP